MILVPLKNIMHKYLIFLLFICISTICLSQEKGDLRIGVFAQVNSFRNKETPMYGLCGEYFLNHHVAMNYRYGLGLNQEGEVTAHINPSLLGIIFLQSGEAIMLSVMIPEGFSYHIYPKEILEIAPYINPLGSEINLYINPEIVLSCNIGINIHIKPVNDLSITPNLSAMIIYQNGEVVPGMGIAINYNFH